MDTELLNFESVANRLKNALKVKADKELAQELGLTPNAYAARKFEKHIPYREIMKTCASKEISVDWIILGKSNDNFLSGNGTK